MNMSALLQHKCYVCDTLIESEINHVFEQITGHSQTPVHLFLEKFVGHSLSSRTEPNFSDALCQQCVNKFDEYDLAVLTSERVQNELLECFTKTLNKYQFKLEVVEQNDCVEFDHYSGYDEGVVLIKGEKEDSYDDCPYEDGDYVPAEAKVTVAKKRTRKKKIKIENPNGVVNENWSFVEVIEKKFKQLFKCQQCNFEFEDKTLFKAHIRSHDVGSKEMHVCDICGQTYKSKTALDIHVGLHKGVSPHKCAICEKKFTQKGALVRHMPIHTGERPYQCDKCGKQFIHYSSFHMHQLAHDNIREKKCSICGLELRSNSHLTRHLRVHSGEKPYSCPTCGQKFAQRYNMTTHLKAHQGIHRTTTKSHSCPACQTTFNKLPKLVEHMATLHNMKMELPSRTNKVQMKSQISKSNTASDAASSNVVALVSEVDLIPNYQNVETNFIGIMEIKNEFTVNVLKNEFTGNVQ